MSKHSFPRAYRMPFQGRFLHIHFQHRPYSVFFLVPSVYSIVLGGQVLFDIREFSISSNDNEISLEKYIPSLKAYLESYFREEMRRNEPYPLVMASLYCRMNSLSTAKEVLRNIPACPDRDMLVFYTRFASSIDNDATHFVVNPDVFKLSKRVQQVPEGVAGECGSKAVDGAAESAAGETRNIPVFSNSEFGEFGKMCSRLDEFTSVLFHVEFFDFLSAGQILSLPSIVKIQNLNLKIYFLIKVAEKLALLRKTAAAALVLLLASDQLLKGPNLLLRIELIQSCLDLIPEDSWKTEIRKALQAKERAEQNRRGIPAININSILYPFGRPHRLNTGLRHNGLSIDCDPPIYALDIFMSRKERNTSDQIVINNRNNLRIEGISARLPDGPACYFSVLSSDRRICLPLPRLLQYAKVDSADNGAAYRQNGHATGHPNTMSSHGTSLDRFVIVELLLEHGVSIPVGLEYTVHTQKLNDAILKEVKETADSRLFTFQTIGNSKKTTLTERTGTVIYHSDHLQVILPRNIDSFSLLVEIQENLFEQRTYKL